MTHDEEQQEQMRQAVMRLRELLDIMRGNLDEAERRYDALFAHLAPEVRQSTPEKALQGMAAEGLLAGGHAPLAHAVLDMRFHARTLEREFDVLYGNIINAVDRPDGA